MAMPTRLSAPLSESVQQNRPRNIVDHRAFSVYASCAHIGDNAVAEQERTPPRPPQKIGVREFRGNLLGYMRQVRQGSSFLVTSRGEVVAVVQPPQTSPSPRRQPGTLRGKIRMAPDFDTLPGDILSVMENEKV